MHRVVLVRPQHSLNVGLACRAMKNFGFTELAIVGTPKKTKTAHMFAKHATEVLANARQVRTLAEALKGCDTAIGTTGAVRRFHKRLKVAHPVSELPRYLKGKCALVFGSEGVGLDAADVDACDVLVTVPTHKSQPVLNLSHAVAVVLHAASRLDAQKAPDRASRTLRLIAEKSWAETVNTLSGIKNKAKVGIAFRRVLERADASEDEVRALLTALGKIKRAVTSGQSKEKPAK